MTSPGYMVWSPEGAMPTYVHPTFDAALTEAQRLKRLCRHRRFYIMSPVHGLADAEAATSFDQGKAEGLAEAHRQIMDAEARMDRAFDKVGDLTSLLRSARPIIDRSRAFQSIVADALLWFDGFAAAHALRDSWDRPNIPDRDQLRQLNGALQELTHQTDQRVADEEIPF
jgi:hypothetical protein